MDVCKYVIKALPRSMADDEVGVVFLFVEPMQMLF